MHEHKFVCIYTYSFGFVAMQAPRLRYAVVFVAVLAATVRSSAADGAGVRHEKQMENEWASMSKKNHKVSGKHT